MTNVSKITAVLALGLGLGTAAMAQDDEQVAPGEMTGITCGDFMMADAALQMEYANAMGVMAEGDVELSADAQQDVATTDEDVQAVAEACNGNEEQLLTDIEMGME